MGSAVDWLGNNADKSIEELQEEASEEGGLDIQPGEQAKSLRCTDCGKIFRTTAQAEFHANKRFDPFALSKLSLHVTDRLLE